MQFAKLVPSKNFLTTLLAVTLSLFSIALPSYAADSAPDDSVKIKLTDELLTLMNVKATMEYAMATQKKSLALNLKGAVAPGLDKEQSDKCQKKMITVFEEGISWDKLKAPVIAVYAKTFSEKELRDLLFFFKTDTGRQYIAKSAELAKNLTAAIEEIMPPVIKKMQESLADCDGN